MSSVGIEELKKHAEDLVTRVEEGGETIEIVHHGRVAAILAPTSAMHSPAVNQETWRTETEAVIASMDRLAEKIAAVWPEGGSALDAIDDIRRDT